MTRIRWAPVGVIVTLVVLAVQLLTGQFGSTPGEPYYGPEWQNFMVVLAIVMLAILVASLWVMADDWNKRSRQVSEDMRSDRQEHLEIVRPLLASQTPFDRELEPVSVPAFLTGSPPPPSPANDWPTRRHPPERIPQHPRLKAVE